MKFLFFTDTHIRASNPSSRKDNFIETLKNKFLEVGKIIEEENVDIILHGGDLFDRPDVSVKIVGLFANILKSYNKPIYIVSGNHDIYGHNPLTIERSMLGLLDTLNIIKLIDKDNPIVLENGNLRVQISGSPYIYDIDSDCNKYYFPSRIDGVDFHIFIIHSFLLDRPFIDSINHTLIDDVINIDADLVLAGHYHSGFGIKKYNDKHFVNPGSLLRTNSSKLEIARKPKVVVFEVNKNEFSIKEIELKTAKEGADVFINNINYDKIHFEALEEFKLLVRQNSNLENYNIYEVLKQISEHNNFPKNILEQALKRLEDIEVNKK